MQPPTAASSVRGIDPARALTLQDALSDLIRVAQFRDRDRACCYELSVSQCYALRAVIREGSLSVNELAGELYLDKSTASRLASGMVAEGYLRKVPDPADARGLRLEPTDRGRALHDRITSDLANEYDRLLEDFSPAEKERVVEAVRRLAGALASRVDTTGGRCCVVD